MGEFMKKLIVGLMALSSLTAYANEGSLVAKIENRKTNAEVRYYRNNNQVVLTHFEQGAETTLKTIEIKLSSNEIKIDGDNSTVFPILRATTSATEDAYEWCFTPQEPVQRQPYDYYASPAGGFYKGPLILITTPLCAVLPVIPSLVGAAMLPVDGVISVVGILNVAGLNLVAS